MYVMADFICMDLLEQLRTQSKWKIRTEKFLMTVEFKPGVSRQGGYVILEWIQSRLVEELSSWQTWKQISRFLQIFIVFFFIKWNISAHFHAIPIHHIKCFFSLFCCLNWKKNFKCTRSK